MNIHNVSSKIKKYAILCKPIFWFVIGFIFAASLLFSFVLLYFKYKYQDRVIPGVFIEQTYVGGKTAEEVEDIFEARNSKVSESALTFTTGDQTATASAESLELGYDSKLISEQAVKLAKNENVFGNFYMIINSYMNGLRLPASYKINYERLDHLLAEIDESVTVEPKNALFSVEGNRVTAFQESRDGKAIDYEALHARVRENLSVVASSATPQDLTINIPIVVTEPEVTTEEANDLGIVEVIGVGKSYFAGSALNRIHNISLAASRVNGVIVPPDEVFSFNENLGDVSQYTGYKTAYVISGGRTVLGDGGGVCQVSTTMFRAILNSGLPVEERHPHSYRVSYYEQQSPMGLDATIYVPSVDLKFKNDTENHILIQSYVNPTEQSLTFTFYGKDDGREVEITEPVVTSQTPAPEPLYEDDPELPKGEIKQVDFAAPGATVQFSRTVTKDGKVLHEDTYTSRYTPWRAVFKRGTKEG